MKMRVVWIVLVSVAMFALAGCSFGGGGISTGGIVSPQDPILSLSNLLVQESREGYANVPGYGTYIEYSYAISGNILNAGSSGQFKVTVYADGTYMTTYGPATINASSVHSMQFPLDTGTSGFWKWAFELSCLDDNGQWQLVERQEIDRTL